ncbi:hypothetical protein, partial [Natrialba sp. PRR66]|uniref:hypothetical protein n=1 Tax=Natrialba sp. PRR66 TaxID=3098146 RepID=UPI002B1E5BDF
PEDGADTIDTTIVKRTFDVIADGTRGAASKKKVDGTWRLLVPNDWKDQARQVATDAADSAVRAGGQ